MRHIQGRKKNDLVDVGAQVLKIPICSAKFGALKVENMSFRPHYKFKLSYIYVYISICIIIK